MSTWSTSNLSTVRPTAIDEGCVVPSGTTVVVTHSAEHPTSIPGKDRWPAPECRARENCKLFIHEFVLAVWHNESDVLITAAAVRMVLNLPLLRER